MLTFGDIWGILMVNATIYSTHGSYGIGPFHRIFAPSSTKTLRCTARATAALRASRYHGILPVSRRAAVKTRGMLRDPKNNAFEGNPGSSNLCIEIFAHLIICYFLVPRDPHCRSISKFSALRSYPSWATGSRAGQTG